MFNRISANEVAQWFLNKNNFMQNITDTEDITNMKLQKLLYYSQGCFLAEYDKPLFKEKVIAWEHGPVVKEVYDEYKKFGGNGIEFPGSNISFSSEVETFLEKIYNHFAQYSAWKLRNMTHEETPWKNTNQNAEIKQSLMREYFKKNNHELC
ncbi:MAG: DUF4065 domain-containing protein [Clostridia bacterium]|nr:DUF4065 domain-containing protein [Clostridia bacterium]